MEFFDLNIPYLEVSGTGKPIPATAARNETRMKLCARALELGYSGVAYNRSVRGPMSDSGVCTTTLFSLPSLLRFAPAAAVKLRRDLLGVPSSVPFRQFRRLTFTIDSLAQAVYLNSSNPILKSYDLVAVRPLSPATFDHVCKFSEVDIIALDFMKQTGRLSLSNMKIAIERGVYFEITYSGIINAQTRREVISNAKLLVDFSQGKNIIFSSGATSVNELRGPRDAANLLSLLGLSGEHAKATLSKNCRSLLDKALSKRKYYKEAIKVEQVPAEQSKDPSCRDWLEWDPISSGEGDLQLDDMAKCFSAAGEVSKNVKAIDFSAIVDGRPPHGLQLNDMLATTTAVPQPSDNNDNNNTKNVLSAAREPEANRKANLLHQLQLHAEGDLTSLFPASKLQTSGCNDQQNSVVLTNSTDVFAGTKEHQIEPVPTDGEKSNHLQWISSCGDNIVMSPTPNNVGVDASFGYELESSSLLRDQNGKPNNREIGVVDLCSPIVVMDEVVADTDRTTQPFGVDAAPDDKVASSTRSSDQNGNCNDREVSDLGLCSLNVMMDEVLADTGKTNERGSLLASHDVAFVENHLEGDQSRDARDDAVLPTQKALLAGSYDEKKRPDDTSILNHELSHEANTAFNSDPVLVSGTSGKRRLKRKACYQPFTFPFKRLSPHMKNPWSLKR